MKTQRYADSVSLPHHVLHSICYLSCESSPTYLLQIRTRPSHPFHGCNPFNLLEAAARKSSMIRSNLLVSYQSSGACLLDLVKSPRNGKMRPYADRHHVAPENSFLDRLFIHGRTSDSLPLFYCSLAFESFLCNLR